MSKAVPNANQPVLVWLIAQGVLLFGAFILWERGLFAQLIDGDRSRLSLVILAGFLAASVHVALWVFRLSREQRHVDELRSRLLAGNHEPWGLDAGTVSYGAQQLDQSLLQSHIRNILTKHGRTSSRRSAGGELQSSLLQALKRRIRARLQAGWLFADIMLKLGLLGTVIGFVLMLGAVATLEDYDISTMQTLMRSMSGGMRVALYTTMTGLVSGMLLGIQYQYLDRKADELLADIEELVDIHVLPGLED